MSAQPSLPASDGLVSPGAPRGHAIGALAGTAVLAAVLTFVTLRAPLLAVWRHGAFFDTDDGMHLLQVRALLAGQNWWDMTVPRLNPPGGTFMHWSRLVDLPVALLIRLFAPLADPATAERLARLVVPFGLLVAFYLAIARLAGLLLGREARLPAIAAALLSGNGVSEFSPGRIDHHGPQILILAVALGSAVAALASPARARQAGLVGLLSGLSLAINLEAMPFLGVIGAALFLRWVWVGDPARRALGWYAGGLAVSLPAFFAAITAPSRYFLPVCDAFGAAHVGAGLIAAAGCAGAALAGTRLPSRVARGAAAAAVALVALAFVAGFYPACLHDPFAAVHPLVRRFWLSQVLESYPLPKLMRTDPTTALCAVLPVTFGLAGCLAAAWRGPRERRPAFALVSAVVASGLALAFWQVRVFNSVTALATLGGVYVALAARRHWLGRGRDALASSSLALLLPFTATGAAMALPAAAAAMPVAGDPPAAASFDACLAPAAFAPLARLRGLAITPVDAGSFVLVHTDLDVLAAAFHRDDEGIRFAFETMLAPATVAERRTVDRGVDYVMTCAGLGETADLAKAAPDGLAADLRAGRIPDWLVRLPLVGTPWQVYRVRPAPSGDPPAQ